MWLQDGLICGERLYGLITRHHLEQYEPQYFSVAVPQRLLLGGLSGLSLSGWWFYVYPITSALCSSHNNAISTGEASHYELCHSIPWFDLTIYKMVRLASYVWKPEPPSPPTRDTACLIKFSSRGGISHAFSTDTMLLIVLTSHLPCRSCKYFISWLQSRSSWVWKIWTARFLAIMALMTYEDQTHPWQRQFY